MGSIRSNLDLNPFSGIARRVDSAIRQFPDAISEGFLSSNFKRERMSFFLRVRRRAGVGPRPLRDRSGTVPVYFL